MDRSAQTRVLRSPPCAAPACGALVRRGARAAPATGVLYACAALGGARPPPAAGGDALAVEHAGARPGAARDAYAMVSIVFEVAVITAPALRRRSSRVASGRGRHAARRSARGGRAGVRAHGAPAGLARRAADAAVRAARAPAMRTVLVGSAAFGTPVGVVQVLLPALPPSAARPRPAACTSRCSSGGLAAGGPSTAALVAGRPARGCRVLLRGRRRASRCSRGGRRRRAGRAAASAQRPALAPTTVVASDPARHRRAAPHRHRGVRGDGDADRAGHGAQRARRRDVELELRGGRAGRGRDRALGAETRASRARPGPLPLPTTSRIAGSASRACSPMNRSCTTATSPGEVSGDQTAAHARSVSSVPGAPTGTNANPERRASAPTEAGPATRLMAGRARGRATGSAARDGRRRAWSRTGCACTP